MTTTHKLAIRQLRAKRQELDAAILVGDAYGMAHEARMVRLYSRVIANEEQRAAATLPKTEMDVYALMNTYVLSLRPGYRVTIQLPKRLTALEKERILIWVQSALACTPN